MVSSKYSPEIEKLLSSGAEAMAAKNYDFAVEYYSEACQLANLESDKDDPDLMYLYGKSLFENAASKNDVLGSKENNNKESIEKDSKNGNEPGNEKGNFQFNDKLAEDEEDDEDEAEGEAEKEVESSGEEVEEQNAKDKNAEEQNEEEQTDFEIAWDILDLTRILYEEELKKLESDPIEMEKLNKKQPYLKSDKLDEFKSITDSNSNSIIVLIKKLSDVYDLLGEISLETENFKQATNDFKSMCELKSKLYPINTGSITEAYYKLSLAWEFCTDDLSNIINSIDAMKKSLESIHARKNVEKDLIIEMEQRLYDLEKGDAKIKEEKEKIMKDILGEITSSSTTGNKKDELEKVNENETETGSISEVPVSLPTTVNDLTQMVRKRKNKPEGGRMVKKVKSNK